MIPPLGDDTTGIHTMKYSEIFLWLNTDVLAEGESHGWLIRRGDDAGGEIQACIYYAIVGEFASEVLKKHHLTGNTHLDFEDYDRFIADKATWHPELETVSEGTAKKLRSNLFKAMREAHLFDKNSDTVLSFLPSPSLTDILRKRADSFGYLPMRESSL